MEPSLPATPAAPTAPATPVAPTTPAAPAGRFRRRGRWGLIALLAVGLVALWGSDRTPPDPHAACHVAGTAANAGPLPGELSVASYNIHHGEGRDGRTDLNRIAEDLQPYDVAALYEVAGFGPWNSGRPQSDRLADQLERQAWFVPTERRWWADHFGNAIVSRSELDAPQRIPLPGTQGKRFRTAMLVHLPLETRVVSVLAVHVDSGVDRERQMQQIQRLFLALEPPAVLMGDLNTPADDPQMQSLLRRDDVIDCVAAADPTQAAEYRIDWILARGLNVVDAGHVDRGHSDHPLVWARLRLD